jgi:hypothetical protein
MSDSIIRRHQALLLGNGALVAVIGLLGGFMLVFSVLGRIEIWPLFALDINVPGEVRAWRAAHVGAITNGLLCAMGAVSLPFIGSASSRKFITYGLIFTAWCNSAFYVFGAFGNTRGLSGGYVEGMGQGNIFDMLAYVPALLAGGITIICMLLIALGTLRSTPEN